MKNLIVAVAVAAVAFSVGYFFVGAWVVSHEAADVATQLVPATEKTYTFPSTQLQPAVNVQPGTGLGQ